MLNTDPYLTQLLNSFELDQSQAVPITVDWPGAGSGTGNQPTVPVEITSPGSVTMLESEHNVAPYSNQDSAKVQVTFPADLQQHGDNISSNILLNDQPLNEVSMETLDTILGDKAWAEVKLDVVDTKLLEDILGEAEMGNNNFERQEINLNQQTCRNLPQPIGVKHENHPEQHHEDIISAAEAVIEEAKNVAAGENVLHLNDSGGSEDEYDDEKMLPRIREKGVTLYKHGFNDIVIPITAAPCGTVLVGAVTDSTHTRSRPRGYVIYGNYFPATGENAAEVIMGHNEVTVTTVHQIGFYKQFLGLERFTQLMIHEEVLQHLRLKHKIDSADEYITHLKSLNLLKEVDKLPCLTICRLCTGVKNVWKAIPRGYRVKFTRKFYHQQHTDLPPHLSGTIDKITQFAHETRYFHKCVPSNIKTPTRRISKAKLNDHIIQQIEEEISKTFRFFIRSHFESVHKAPFQGIMQHLHKYQLLGQKDDSKLDFCYYCRCDYNVELLGVIISIDRLYDK